MFQTYLEADKYQILLLRYDDYIECVHKSKQNLRVKAMHKKRHVDNHIEYLQVSIFMLPNPPHSPIFFLEKYHSVLVPILTSESPYRAQNWVPIESIFVTKY